MRTLFKTVSYTHLDVYKRQATVPLMSLSEIVIISGIVAVKESLKTFARNVAYRTIRMTGVIIDVNNIPLSLKNSFLFPVSYTHLSGIIPLIPVLLLFLLFPCLFLLFLPVYGNVLQ